MIHFESSLNSISEHDLHGFFVGWPNPPDASTLYAILENSAEVVLAIDSEAGSVVGFINALTDHVLMAFISLLEVLPAYQDRGIGGELIHRMFDRLKDYYAIDLLCDVELQGYYSRFGMHPATGMMFRNYQNQSGRKRV